jgi:hypothetical protein
MDIIGDLTKLAFILLVIGIFLFYLYISFLINGLIGSIGFLIIWLFGSLLEDKIY